MAKPAFFFLPVFCFLLVAFLLHPISTDATENKHYPVLPSPAPIAAALDRNAKIPPNLFLSTTFPSAHSTALHSTTSNTISNTEASSSSLIHQLVAQNFAEPSGAFGHAFKQILNGLDDNTSNNQTYDGLRQFWHVDILNSVTSIGSFISNFINNLTSVYLPYLVGCLCAIVKSFFLNTDLTKVEDSSASNDFSYMLTQLANTIYGIAIDLSLLLFILSIWRYWTQAAWHGSGSPMSAIGRLIATVFLMLAWTTIYKFEISLSNEMLSALFPDSTGQIEFFDLIMSNLLHKTSTYPTTAGLLAAVPATEYVPAANGIMQGIVALAPMVVSVVLVFLVIVLIYELLYLIVLKAIQTSLLTAQYVFAPFFLVFLSNPVTDSIATSFLRSFIEVSLWNFIWIGLLKILIILLYSNFNPWGKILTAIGVLQLMMQVPQFLAHAKISVASDFVSPHFFAKALKDVSGYDDKIKRGTETLRQFFTGTSAHSTHKEKIPATMPIKDNFSFTDNNSHNINLQPPKKLNPSTGQSTNTNSAPGASSDKNRETGYGSFAAGGTGSTSTAGSTSATNLAAGGAFAYASATSIAAAISIAIATVTKPPGGSRPDSPPPPDPNSPKPGPGPFNPDPIKPNSGPSQPDLGTNPGSSPPPKLYSGPPNTDTSPIRSLWNGPPKRPDPGSAPQAKSNSNPDPSNILGTGSNLSQLKYLQNKQERNTVSPHHFVSKTPNQSGLPNNGLPDFQLATNGPPLAKSTNLSKASPQTAINQTFAFQSGALNYHLHKKRLRASRLNGNFYHPVKTFGTYGTAEALFSQRAYNLIFSHGNSPPLMGIPPIYPAPN